MFFAQPGLHIGQKPPGRAFTEMIDLFKVFNTAVVGVGNFSGAHRIPFPEEVDFFILPGRFGQPPQLAGIVLVHGNQKIKVVKIRTMNLASPVVQTDAVPGRCLPGPVVGKFPHMVTGGSRRFDLDEGRQTRFLNLMAEHAFGQGRTANIPQANKKDFQNIAPEKNLPQTLSKRQSDCLDVCKSS